MQDLKHHLNRFRSRTAFLRRYNSASLKHPISEVFTPKWKRGLYKQFILFVSCRKRSYWGRKAHRLVEKWRNTSIRPQACAGQQLFKGLYLIFQAYILTTSLFKIPGWKTPFSCERRASAGTSGVFKHARCSVKEENYLHFRESTNGVQAIMHSQCSGMELATIRHVVGAERFQMARSSRCDQITLSTHVQRPCSVSDKDINTPAKLWAATRTLFRWIIRKSVKRRWSEKRWKDRWG